MTRAELERLAFDVATEVAARSAPDGYTILATVDLPLAKAPNLVRIAYDPLKDFVPVAIVAEDFNVLAKLRETDE